MKIFNIIKLKLNKISIVDKTLILIMSVSLIFLCISLFFPVNSTLSNEKINGVFRTSCSAIFGYILSGNFGRNNNKEQVQLSQLQITYTAFIGIFSMFVLIFLSLFIPLQNISTDDISTLTMIRDFVSGSVGFLIGSPKSK